MRCAGLLLSLNTVHSCHLACERKMSGVVLSAGCRPALNAKEGCSARTVGLVSVGGHPHASSTPLTSSSTWSSTRLRLLPPARAHSCCCPLLPRRPHDRSTSLPTQHLLRPHTHAGPRLITATRTPHTPPTFPPRSPLSSLPQSLTSLPCRPMTCLCGRPTSSPSSNNSCGGPRKTYASHPRNSLPPFPLPLPHPLTPPSPTPSFLSFPLLLPFPLSPTPL